MIKNIRLLEEVADRECSCSEDINAQLCTSCEAGGLLNDIVSQIDYFLISNNIVNQVDYFLKKA